MERGNVNVGGPSPQILSSFDVGSAPIVSSVVIVSRDAFDPIVARQQSQDKKYPPMEVCHKETKAWIKVYKRRECSLGMQFLQE